MAWTTFEHLPVVLAQSEDTRPDVAPPTPPATNGGQQTGETQDGAAGNADGADGGGLGGNGAGNGGGGGGGGLGSMWLIFLLVLVVMWVFLIGGQRKEKKKRAALLAALAKGDRVQTVGGILGTVVEVRDDEVIVKVDENTNARMRFSRSAIQSVLNDKGAGEVELKDK
jgi:preprotein translocase subunit YajC